MLCAFHWPIALTIVRCFLLFSSFLIPVRMVCPLLDLWGNLSNFGIRPAKSSSSVMASKDCYRSDPKLIRASMRSIKANYEHIIRFNYNFFLWLNLKNANCVLIGTCLTSFLVGQSPIVHMDSIYPHSMRHIRS